MFAQRISCCIGLVFALAAVAYAYEKGTSSITTLHWDDTAGKLTQEGVHVGSVDELVKVVGR